MHTRSCIYHHFAKIQRSRCKSRKNLTVLFRRLVVLSRWCLSMKLGYGLKLRSRRVVQDSTAAMTAAPAEEEEEEEEVDELRQSCWAEMPLELLREVMMRIEASESSWPTRRNAVACAGVCRSWREIMKEVVKTPEETGKLTFPISLKQPGPRDSLLQCFIRRNRLTQSYHLYLNLTQALFDDGKFLLASRKFRRATYTDYYISLHPDNMSRGCSTYIGKLRSNFIGTKFITYDGLPPHAGPRMMKSSSNRLVGSKQVSPRVSAGNYPVTHISYELNVAGSRGPRRMHCVMDTIPASAIEPGGVAPTQTEFPLSSMDFFPSLPFFRSRSSCAENFLCGPSTNHKEKALVLENKAPRWNEQLHCWCLNFHGRVTVASVKNFQLVASTGSGQAELGHEEAILQFGKVGKDMFTMDYRYPLSAFQAFAICLSSFETKIACE